MVGREYYLVTNNDSKNFYKELKDSFVGCKKFYFSVAFINFQGLQLLLDSIEEMDSSFVEGKIITSNYLNFTDAKSLRRLKRFSNIDTKLFIVGERGSGFHTKGYIFEYEDSYKIIVGSSNITRSALKSNVEWNLSVIEKKDSLFVKEVIAEFEKLWSITSKITDDFLDQYEIFMKSLKEFERTERKFVFTEEFEPNVMQQKAIISLEHLRESGERKALLISATGTGKTYMSAFDVRKYNPKKLLFLVHRENILNDAIDTFKTVIKSKSMGKLTGNIKNYDKDYIFSSIYTMHKDAHLSKFDKDEFDYIIIDEAHRSASKSYRKILDYFEPDFLLGMTATPERTDDQSIYELYDGNVALEIRLREALDMNLVVPFHYYGIHDDTIDLEGVDLKNVDLLAKKFNIKERVNFIISKIKHYDNDGFRTKCLGFCVSVEHAKYMASEFNKRGLTSIALSGSNTVEEREQAIQRLESDIDQLEYIFTVDIFNEGIDIPEVNLVLMLRPTTSSIIFTQQLGRGLRKTTSKAFLTVLDFIGNHSKTFLLPIALSGAQFYDKDSLRVLVEEEFEGHLGDSNISFDKISKERILGNLDSVNFNDMKYLKEEYLSVKKIVGAIPLWTDFLTPGISADLLKFIRKTSKGNNGSLLYFINGIEKDLVFPDVLPFIEKMTVLKYLERMLPLCRIEEFVILKTLVEKEKCSKELFIDEMLRYVDYTNTITIDHALSNLLQEFSDSNELKRDIALIESVGDNFELSNQFREYLDNSQFNRLVKNILTYGLISYQNDYGRFDYGYPFMKLYGKYRKRDMGIVTSYYKTHSSIRDGGLWTNGDDYYLFVDLKKNENIKDSIKYADKILSREMFQWESPNSTKQSSERGRNIIYNKERRISLHLLVRKFKVLDNITQKFIYLGKVNTVKYSGEKPIRVEMKFENTLPIEIFNDLIK